MKIGILSDAHGNNSATLNCLKLLKSKDVEIIIYLGDYVGYMPEAKEVFDELQQQYIVCLRGNHEEMLLENCSFSDEKNDIYRIKEIRQALGESYLTETARWATSLRAKIEKRDLFFVHGSPWDYTGGYIYADSDFAQFEKLSYDAVFMGHTHRPYIQHRDSKLIVNVGSCGLPRDAGNHSSCAVYDTKNGKCAIFRIPFDAEALIRSFRGRVHDSVIECLRRNESVPLTLGTKA